MISTEAEGDGLPAPMGRGSLALPAAEQALVRATREARATVVAVRCFMGPLGS